MTKIAINGFGRIGRMVCRALYESEHSNNIQLIAINDLVDAKISAHLLQYDSVHKTMSAKVRVEDETLVINQDQIRITRIANPAELPWGDMGIDLVLECSGRFTARDQAALHLKAGAKRVLISAPAADADKTIVVGVNDKEITAADEIISNGSCTTNCLVPIVAILDKYIGIDKGYMTTVHAYTADQSTVDTGHKDLRRARAAAVNIIPTSTGAAKVLGLVLPSLQDKLDGCAVRVPTANVSMVDLTMSAARDTSPQEINQIMSAAAAGELKGILAINELPLVSSDFIHNPHSSIFDATQTQVVGGNFVRVLSWYDNEWGFSNRMIELASSLCSDKQK